MTYFFTHYDVIDQLLFRSRNPSGANECKLLLLGCSLPRFIPLNKFNTGVL